MTEAVIEIHQPEEIGNEVITGAEYERMDILIGSVISDALNGVTYADYAVTYDQATNTATWEHRHRTMEVTVSQRDGASMITLVRKLWDETGCDFNTTAVAIVGSEARVTRSVIRNNGIVFEPEQTSPLDRRTYDATLEDLVDLKRLGGQESEQPKRSMAPGRLRWFIRRSQ